MPRVYLAGPMTGYTDHNYPEFNRVSGILNKWGYDVLNPAMNFHGRSDLPYDVYIREDLKLMSFADELVLLPGWKISKGCLLEFHAAIVLGLRINEWDAVYDELRSIVGDPMEHLITGLIGKVFWKTPEELFPEGVDDAGSD